jgi:hypothetical protein
MAHLTSIERDPTPRRYLLPVEVGIPILYDFVVAR